jgi:hypothetical protein
VGAHLAFVFATRLRQIVVLYDVTFAKFIVFDCLLTVENRIWTTEQVKVVVVIPVVVKVGPRLWLAEKVWEVSVITA